MKYICVDIGSYSVKFLQVIPDRNRLRFLSLDEIIISKVRDNYGDDDSTEDIQADIVKIFFEEFPENEEHRIIHLLPTEYTTSRFLDIPVPNKKRAEMMIPYQLEENLPFSLDSIHFSPSLVKNKDGMRATVHISKYDHFQEFFQRYEQENILPHVLTTELGVMENFVENFNYQGTYAIFDIGHRTTKSYYILDKKVVANHVSYFAGKIVDSVLAKTYNISDSEAIEYKHQNSYFLTENQYEEVNEDQKDFAKIMKQAIWPLINDMRRWELGFRIKNGVAIDRIFITGGTSNINNISNFLSQSLGIKVDLLDTSNLYQNEAEAEINALSLGMSTLMAYSSANKSPLVSMLTGRFTHNIGGDLPLHSSIYLFTRVLIVSLLLIASLSIERIFVLNKKDLVLDRSIKKLLKNPSLSIPRKVSNQIRRRPEVVLKHLKKESKSISQTVSSIMSSTEINGVKEIPKVSTLISSIEDATLLSFKNDGEKVELSIESKNSSSLKNLEKSFKEYGYTGFISEIKNETLFVSFDS